MEQSTSVKDLLTRLGELESRTVSAAKLLASQQQRKRGELGMALLDQLQARQMQTVEFLHAALAGPLDAARTETVATLLKQAVGEAEGLLIALGQVLAEDRGQQRRVVLQAVPIRDIFDTLRVRFADTHAGRARVRICRSRALLHSNPSMLIRLLHALVTYATEMAGADRVLIGCRQRGRQPLIEVWVRGGTVGASVGMRPLDRDVLFYELLAARFGEVLGHRADCVWTSAGVAVFRVWLDLVPKSATVETAAGGTVSPVRVTDGNLLIVSEDRVLRRALAIMLERSPFQPIELTSIANGTEPHPRALNPVCMIFDVPLRIGNAQTIRTEIEALRESVGWSVPAVILRNARSLGISEPGIELEKPVRAADVIGSIQRLVEEGRQRPIPASRDPARSVFLVGAEGLPRLREPVPLVQSYENAEAFAADDVEGRIGCVLVDADAPGLHLRSFLKYMAEERPQLPVIVISINTRVARVVQAMRAGALDYLAKPVQAAEFQTCLDHAFSVAQKRAVQCSQAAPSARLSGLTPRERDVLDLVYRGRSSKVIAHELGISPRTVEYYRSALMKKLGAKSLPDLVRLVVEAGGPLVSSAPPQKGVRRYKSDSEGVSRIPARG